MQNHRQYQLQTLFDVREQAKKSAEEIFVAAQNEARAQEDKVRVLCDDLKNLLDFRERKTHEYANNMVLGQTIQTIHYQRHHIDSLKKKEGSLQIEIDHQRKVLEQAKDITNQKLKLMLKATQDFKALEKLKETWESDLKKALEKSEEDIAEDISQSQHFTQRFEQ